MKTSYFFNRNLKNFGKEKIIAISVGIPKSYDGHVYNALAPTWAMINRYKKDGNEKDYIEQYEKQILNKLNPQKVYADLGKDAILLCWEGSSKFCHRHLMARWLEKNIMNLKITELED